MTKGYVLKKELGAVFFDIGGTLVAKTRYAERDPRAIFGMIALLQLDCQPTELVEQINRGQQAYKKWSEKTLSELTVEEKWVRFLLPELDSDLVRGKAQHLQQMWRTSKGKASVKDDALSVLTKIKQRGYTLGTISHSTPKYLDEPGIADLLDVRIHAPEFGKRKPHPSLFVEAARRCGLDPAQCAYVGDNPWRDVVGPREAGYGSVILMKNGGPDPAENPAMMQPDMVIHDLNELLELFPHRLTMPPVKLTNTENKVLYDAALSTMWWDKEAYTAQEFFTRGRELGFTRFELNHQTPPEVLAQIDHNQFSIGSLHDPCPANVAAKVLEQTDIQITSLNEDRRRKGVDVVKATLDQACLMGCRMVVVHPGRIICDHTPDNQLRALYQAGKKGTMEYEEQRLRTIADRAAHAAPHLDKCLESLHEIVDFAAGMGLMIGLENRFHYYELPVSNEMQVILEEFQQPWIGWQFDFGHLQVHEALGLLSLQEWLERFSQRIIGVHMHDVKGIMDHQGPGSGDIDYARIARYLPADCYRTLEVDKALGFEELARSMQYLADLGCVNRI